MKKLLPIVIFLSLTILACGSSTNSTLSTIKENPVLESTTTKQKTLETKIIKSTSTQEPTSTPKPTSTSKPIAEPVEIEGAGDSVVNMDLKPFDGAAVAYITNTGSSNFSVWTLSSDFEQNDLLINTIGKYQGYVPINFNGDDAKSLQISSSGSWKVILYPIEYIVASHILTSSSTYVGTGDDVVYVSNAPGLATFKTDTSSNFAVWAYSSNDVDLLINEIAPYSGVIPIKKDVLLLVVTCEGPWSVELN